MSKQINEDGLDLAKILFILLVGFSVILNNITLTTQIESKVTNILLSIVTIGIAALMIYFTLHYQNKYLEKRW